MTSNQKIYRASKKRAIAMIVISIVGIAFGIFLYRAIPIEPIRYAFAAIAVVVAGTNMLSIVRTRLTWGDGMVRYQTMMSGWSVAVNQIESWKIRKNSGGDANTSFELFTQDGAKYQIPDMSLLSVESYDDFSHDFAALLCAAKNN